MDRTIQLHPITCEGDEALLRNPDRGFRMETWCNPGNLAEDNQRMHEDPADMLREQVVYYAPESPRLAQVYFYLTNFKNTPVISEYGINRIQRYFDTARELGIKLLVRFAYQGDGDGTGEAADDIMLQHMQQLKPLLEKNKDVIHLVQSGFLGAWGEWHSYKMEHDRLKLIRGIAEMAPDGLFLQIRLPKYKNILEKDDPLYSRIGFNIDSLFGYVEPDQMGRGTDGVDPGLPDWMQVTRESPYVPVDGELYWGIWSINEHHNDRDGFMIDGHGVIRELSEHHFNSMSVHHNYREKGEAYKFSMQYWKETELTPEWLEEYGLLYAPGWFRKADGSPAKRTVFDYARDYLGYKLELRQLTLRGEAVRGGTLHAVLDLVNYGFSVPFCMEESGFALLDASGNLVSETPAGAPLTWHSRNPEDYNDARLLTHKVEADIALPDEKGTYTLAFYLRNSMGTGARVGNVEQFENGRTLLCQVTVD